MIFFGGGGSSSSSNDNNHFKENAGVAMYYLSCVLSKSWWGNPWKKKGKVSGERKEGIYLHFDPRCRRPLMIFLFDSVMFY